jgi:ubiquinone/menaquinone biosynthesis C-methylase UbiE
VEALPFQDDIFSGVMCTLAIHHFQALRPAFQEAFRVLATGRFVLFTGTAEQMHGYWLNAYFPTAMARSIAQMPSLPEIGHALRERMTIRGSYDIFATMFGKIFSLSADARTLPCQAR